MWIRFHNLDATFYSNATGTQKEAGIIYFLIIVYIIPSFISWKDVFSFMYMPYRYIIILLKTRVSIQ